MLSCIYHKKIATAVIDRQGYFSRCFTAARVLFLLMAVAFWLACADASYGAIIIDAPMTDTNSSGWTLGGNPNSSLLTGNGVIDPVGQGWLRLTNNSTNQTGFAYNNTSFDLSGGLLIQYDYVTWGGNGADGYSIFLFDAGVSTFNIGAFGGSVGYAQKLPPAVPTAVPGISGGYVGVSIDEWGNFANPTEGRYLGPGQRPNTVSIRGSVVGFGGGAIGQTSGTTSYPWIATSPNNGSLWYNGATRPDQTSANYRKVVIRITPAPNPTVDVWIQFGYNQPLTQMISGQPLPAISTSQLLKVGYAASTGASTNYHEIRNLLVTSFDTSTAIDVGVTKSVLDTTTNSTTVTSVGDGIRYTVLARNYGPNNITATGVGIVDNIPAAITGVSWTCAVVAGSPVGTSCGSASGSGNNLNTTANLPFGGAVTYTINGTVSAPAPSPLSNTASLVIPGSVIDYNHNNNSATASIAVTSNLSTSTKTLVDVNGGSYEVGDTLQYTITIKETKGIAASGVSVSDPIHANLTNVTPVSCGGGGSCTYTAPNLNCSGISVPANGSVTIVYTADISGSATPGTTITNTAIITNPGVAITTVTAPVVTVAGTTTGTGNKLLYLYDNASSPTRKLSRTPMTVNASSYVEIPEITTYTWTLSPSLASGVTINSGNIPVRLLLSSTNTRTYDIPLTLRCGAATVATLTTGSIYLINGAAPIAFNVNLPLASNYTCPAGNAFYLDVRNDESGWGTRNIRVYPAPAAGNYSYVNLPSQSVINVNSMSFYDAAYSGGNLLSSIPVSSTVYIRAVVSDPFGSYDIVNAPTIIIKNPSGTTIASGAMTLVATGTETPSLTKTYEYAYAVPSSPTGNWSVSVTATEGTEGTVTNTAYATMPVVVVLPNLFILKSADKSNASTGEVITYTIQVKNDGTGAAHTVTLTDSLGKYVALPVTSSFTFTQGTPTSGLTLGTPTYSNDHGANYTYTLQSGAGGVPANYDGVVTNWKIIMNNTMNANGSNFTLNYQAIIK